MHAKQKKPSDNYSVAPTATRSSIYWENMKVRKSHTFKLEEKNCCVYNSRTHAHTSTQEDTDEVQSLKLQSVV